MWKIDAFCVICTFIGSCVWRCLLWYSWTYLEGADLKHILGDLSRCIESNCFFKSDLLNWNEFMNTTMQILGDCQLPIKTQLNSISTHYNTQYILYALHIYKSIKMRRKRERERDEKERRERQTDLYHLYNQFYTVYTSMEYLCLYATLASFLRHMTWWNDKNRNLHRYRTPEIPGDPSWSACQPGTTSPQDQQLQVNQKKGVA